MAGSVTRVERMVRSGDAEIYTEAFGDPGDEPLLLIMGQMASMLWWPEEFCERLARSGRFVIRYDNRDTGRSTSYPAGAPGYTFDDFVEDAIAILDAYGIDRGHLVGFSMGGMLAQVIAVRHPERVATLTVMSNTAVAGGGDLPGPAQAYLDHAAQYSDVDWKDPAQVAEMIVAEMRSISSTKHPHDEDAARAFVALDLGRTRNPASLVNHTMLDGDDVADDAVENLPMPVLVVHGTSDPLFPPAHGEALAARVPNGRLVLIDGGGHELHESDWDEVAAAVLAHTASG